MPFNVVEPVIDPRVRGLCTKPYEGHPKGCPNFGRCDRCPPHAPTIENMIDLSRPVFVVWNAFPLGEHIEKMRVKHPDWTERQLLNCLYWQGTARKQLKQKIEDFRWYTLIRNPGFRYIVLTTPEACGVNVTETMASVGEALQWPARTVAYQVAIVGCSARTRCTP